MPRITLAPLAALTALTLGALVATAPAAAASADPIARTQALIAAFKQVTKPAEGASLTPAQRATNAKAFTALDAYFDRATLTSRPIAPNVAKFSAAQKAAFKETFWSLIRLVAYPDSGAFFKEAKWSLKPGKAPLTVDLLAELEEEDMETTVTFYWREIDGALRLVDVGFDGASLMKDYTAQFSRIIAKSGVEGLMKKLDKRFKAEKKARAGLLP